jgi:plasmid stabilization system protein ParE
MDYQIVITPEAQYDFREVWNYISRDSYLAADRFTTLLSSKTKILGPHPEIGRIVPEFGNRGIREIIDKNYRVVYIVDSLKKQILILCYWNAARGFPDIQFK